MLRDLRPAARSTNPNAPEFSAYNQVINGHKYWTQLTFSNRSFAKFGVAQGCVGKAFVPAGSSSASVAEPDLNDGRLTATPNELPNDGTRPRR